MLRVEVVYARAAHQYLVRLELEDGATVAEALHRSGLVARFPEVEPTNCRVGIYGRVVEARRLLRDGDRVEIYQPLVADPKAARRERVRRSAQPHR